MFRVGQKVVCVDFSPSYRGVPMPFKKGWVYTVSNTMDTWEGQGVELAEIETPSIAGHYRAWHARRFRPIVDRKTDISVFQEILRKVTRPSPVDAEIGVG